MTESNNTQQLTIQQENAIDLLITGISDREVAELVKVNRSTVNQWQNHNAVFIAELNGRRKVIWGSQEERLRNLVSKAVDVLEEDLDSDNPKLRQSAAIHILKAVKLYGEISAPSGYTNADDLVTEWANSERFSETIRALSGI